MSQRRAIIDNGRRRRLVIAGLFDGTAGESEGLLSFIPNRSGARPADVRAGLLDGQPVLLELVPSAAQPFVTYRYGGL